MRVNRITPRDDTAPYNTIFESYGDILHSLFESRRDVELGEKPYDGDTYVAMPEPQREIVDFAKSGSSDICLVVGSIGIGKTSVIRHLVDEVWPNQGCLVIHHDFKLQSEVESLGPDYFSLPPKIQREKADSVAVERIKATLKKKLYKDVGDLKSNEYQTRFHAFLELFYSELLPDEEMLGTSNASQVVQKMLARNPYDCITKMFLFMIYEKKYQHIKIILDNLDDKDSVLISCLAEQIAHLSSAIIDFSRREADLQNADRIRRWTSAFIACRPSTSENLMKHRYPGHHWFGIREIVIHRPCSLSNLTMKRYKKKIAGKSVPGDNDRKLRFTMGTIPWTIDDRDKFFNALCKAFQDSGQSEHVVRLCNYNMASAMTAMLNVMRNRHFTKPESLLASTMPPEKFVQIEDKLTGVTGHHRGAFTNLTVLRALAYGNQGDVDSPMYPIRNTMVPNILHSEYSKFGKSALKLRILMCFIQQMRGQSQRDVQIGVGDICEFALRFFTVKADDSAKLIDELYYQGLLGNDRLDDVPSRVGPDCTLTITPRAMFLIEQLSRDSILLQCYRDEIDLPSVQDWGSLSHSATDRPTLSFMISDTLKELFWLIVFYWQGERRELERCIQSGHYLDFSMRCGETPVSLQLLQGVRASVGAFFSKYSDMEVQAYSEYLQRLDEEIREFVRSA